MARCEKCIHSGICKMEITPNWNRENCPWCKSTADVVPKSEIAKLQQEVETLKDNNEHLAVMLSEAKTEAAREIFKEIDILGTYNPKLYAELKKKYTEEKE